MMVQGWCLIRWLVFMNALLWMALARLQKFLWWSRKRNCSEWVRNRVKTQKGVAVQFGLCFASLCKGQWRGIHYCRALKKTANDVLGLEDTHISFSSVLSAKRRFDTCPVDKALLELDKPCLNFCPFSALHGQVIGQFLPKTSKHHVLLLLGQDSHFLTLSLVLVYWIGKMPFHLSEGSSMSSLEHKDHIFLFIESA